MSLDSRISLKIWIFPHYNASIRKVCVPLSHAPRLPSATALIVCLHGVTTFYVHAFPLDLSGLKVFRHKPSAYPLRQNKRLKGDASTELCHPTLLAEEQGHCHTKKASGSLSKAFSAEMPRRKQKMTKLLR